MQYHIDKSAKSHKGKTGPEIEKLCENAKRVLEEYSRRENWNISVDVGYASGNLAEGPEETKRLKTLQALECHVRQFPGAYDKTLDVEEVLASFSPPELD